MSNWHVLSFWHWLVQRHSPGFYRWYTAGISTLRPVYEAFLWFWGLAYATMFPSLPFLSHCPLPYSVAPVKEQEMKPCILLVRVWWSLVWRHAWYRAVSSQEREKVSWLQARVWQIARDWEMSLDSHYSVLLSCWSWSSLLCRARAIVFSQCVPAFAFSRPLSLGHSHVVAKGPEIPTFSGVLV